MNKVSGPEQPAGGTMQIDTREFRALTAQVAELCAEVDSITRHLQAQADLTELLLRNTLTQAQLREVTNRGGRTAQILYLHPAGGDTA